MPDGQPDPQTVTANCSIGGKKKKKKTKLQTIHSMHKQWPSCTVQMFLRSLYNLSPIIANTTQFLIQ